MTQYIAVLAELIGVVAATMILGLSRLLNAAH